MKSGEVRDGSKFWGALFFSLINVMFNGMAELAMTVFRLPVFYKQRDSLFYPAWAFGLPIWALRIPISFLESGIWIILTYYTIGFAPAASRWGLVLYHSQSFHFVMLLNYETRSEISVVWLHVFVVYRFFKQFLAFFGVHQMALSLFRFIAALGRTEVVASTIGSFTLLLVFVLGGYIVAKG